MEQQMNGILDSYRLENAHYDEVFTDAKYPKEHYQSILERFNQLTLADFERINNEVKTAFLTRESLLPFILTTKSPTNEFFHSICFPGLFPTMNGCNWKRASFSEIRQSTCFFTISTTKSRF
jgi:hypothetical protein